MKLIIGADFVPTESNSAIFEAGDIETLFGQELLKIFMEADYRIFNLEVPLTDIKSPIKKRGPALSACTSTINAYKKIHTNLLAVANNHIMDQGEQGLISTLAILDMVGIAHVGAGRNLDEAKSTYAFTVGSIVIGVYACAEHEFSIATDVQGGANPFDVLESFEHVKQLKMKCDYVIVLYHGGIELYRYPSPDQQKYCRKFVDNGADLVVCQHSHCIGCKEKYGKGLIVYGQGNLLFDHSENDCWNTSVLLEVSDDYEVKFIPLVKKGNTVRIADKKQSKKILEDFATRSSQILEREFIQNQYHLYSAQMLNTFYSRILGKIGSNLCFRLLNKLTKRRFVEKFFTQASDLAILNVLECESHRELFIDGLKERIWKQNVNYKNTI